MNDRNFADIISDLKKSEERLNVYIPSLSSEIEFKALTLLQQKNIIDNLSNNLFGVIEFYSVIHNLIKSSTTHDISTLNTIDRINIILSFVKNISPVCNDINMVELLEKNKTITLPELKKTITTDKFVLEISTPNLTTDIKFNNYIVNNYKNEKALLGKLLINEVSKFVNKITVSETGQVIDLTELSVKNAILVIEAIDTKQLKEVFGYITTIRDTEALLVKYEDKRLEIGPELFIM